MNEPNIGQLCDDLAKRDAIHVAVAPVIAGEALAPGDHVGRSIGGVFFILSPINCLGIVDPFLKSQVKKGEKFWLFLYPKSTTSLRHVWEHPAFKYTPTT